jgi:hypothetical protein
MPPRISRLCELANSQTNILPLIKKIVGVQGRRLYLLLYKSKARGGDYVAAWHGLYFILAIRWLAMRTFAPSAAPVM